VRERQYNGAIAGLIGIAPQDEIEGMIAAQLIAAHNATWAWAVLAAPPPRLVD
jgi:hypothetical protein